MDWDENLGAPTYCGSVPIDNSAPLRVGERVTVRKNDIEYEVELAEVSGVDLKGTVHRIITPPSAQESLDRVKIGNTVMLKRSHIYTVYRQ